MSQRENITVEMAIVKLVDGLRAIPDNFQQVGCAIADPKIRQSHYTAMINWGRDFASKLESLPANEALLEIQRYENKLANLDPIGWHIGNWASVARLLASGQPHSMVDGALCSH